MVLKLLIIFVCYMPILDDILPSTNFGPGIPDIGPILLCSYFLMLTFIIQVAVTGTVRLRNRWIGLLAAFFLIVVASVSWSCYSYSRHIIQQLFGSVFTPTFVAVVAMNVFQEKNHARFYIKHVIISGVILSLLSVIQMARVLLVGQDSSGIFRSAGTLGNPNLLAIFLVLTIPCILYAFDVRLLSSRLCVVVMSSIVAGVLSSVSRKGVFTLVLSLLVFALIKKHYQKIMLTAVLFTVLAVALSQWSVFRSRFDLQAMKDDIHGKWMMTAAGFKMFAKRPVTGLGYNGYFENFGTYFPGSWTDKYDAHNIFITSLANYGLIGFIPFLGIFFHPLFAAMRVLRGSTGGVSTTEYLRNIAPICVLSLIPYMVAGWFAGGLTYEPVISSLLYTNVALFLAPYYREVT